MGASSTDGPLAGEALTDGVEAMYSGEFGSKSGSSKAPSGGGVLAGEASGSRESGGDSMVASLTCSIFYALRWREKTSLHGYRRVILSCCVEQ